MTALDQPVGQLQGEAACCAALEARTHGEEDMPGLAARAAHLKEEMKNAIIDNLNYARTHGTDRAEIVNWVWPG